MGRTKKMDVGAQIQLQSVSKTAEEMAEYEKERAREKNLPEPDFDFRDMFKPGDTVYYVWVNYLTGDKELLNLKLRTVYARSMVGWEEKGCAHMIGYQTKDYIFWDRHQAEELYKDLDVEAQYGRK